MEMDVDGDLGQRKIHDEEVNGNNQSGKPTSGALINVQKLNSSQIRHVPRFEPSPKSRPLIRMLLCSKTPSGHDLNLIQVLVSLAVEKGMKPFSR